PADVVDRIVEAQLSKWKAVVTLLEQAPVNADKHDSRTIEQMREDLAAKVGENVVISRIACFRIGG
ncbi:MAG: elongation factor Ts, partial [Solirubrobacterales bacterium]